MVKSSPTNDTTRNVLKRLFDLGVPAWRHNVLPVPISRAGTVVGFRPGGKSGISDIVGYLPAGLFTVRGEQCRHAVPLYIEVKTGKDRLRPEQIGFLDQATRYGCVVMVIKDFNDFERQWNDLIRKV